MKVLHLPAMAGGNAWSLAQGERALGLESDVLTASDTTYQYPAHVKLRIDRTSSNVVKLAQLGTAFLRVRSKYDVFHFNFGSSLIHAPAHNLVLAEIGLYPRSAKLFATYNGCDARQKYPTMARVAIAPCHNPNCYGGQCNSGQLDEQRRQGIARMSKYARHIWAVNPDLLYFLPPQISTFLPYAVSEEGVAPEPSRARDKLVIVHAPTDRAGKGTDHVLSAVSKAQARYPGRVELRMIEGLTHAGAITAYRDADLAIDQVLVGWYGAFAVEAMLLGLPVIARIAAEDLQFVPTPMASDVLEAVISADPVTLEETIFRCVEDRAFLRAHGEACAAYARKWHSPKYVAGLTKEKYEAA